MNDTITCPKCHRTGFTAAGLKRHACKPLSSASTVAASAPKSAPEPATVSLEIVPATAKAPAKVAPIDDALMGVQLTEQYHLATGGMREVLKFGAMMLKVRDIVSTRGHDRSRGGGRDTKGDGLKGWIEEHAAEINRATAYRFMHVAEAVQQAFELPSKVSFVELATIPTNELPEKLQKKQLELWDFVSGTSQRSWLDRFAPPVEKGGTKKKKSAPLTPEETEALLDKEANEVFRNFAGAVITARDTHRDLLLRLPAVSIDPATQMGLVQLRDEIRPLFDLIEDALHAKKAVI